MQYRTQYNCLCEAVDAIVILLGREGTQWCVYILLLVMCMYVHLEGSEKLIGALHSATPNNVLRDKVSHIRLTIK